jgi:ribonuclease P protein component
MAILPLMEATGSLRLRREMRLRSSAEFARLKENGRRLVKGCLIANWSEEAGSAGERLRLGVITPKNIGPAVARNRARRLMREAFRLNQRRLRTPLALALIARPSIARKVLADVEKDFLQLMRQARVLLEE